MIFEIKIKKKNNGLKLNYYFMKLNIFNLKK
jgi:hypothetical protein